MIQRLAITCALTALLGACTPLTQLEDVTAQNELKVRPLNTVLLIGVTSEDATRRRYENRCAERFAATAGGYPKRLIASHEVFPDGNSLTRETVSSWLENNDQVDGILVMQLAAVSQHSGNLNAGGVQERYGINLYQPGLAWNYQQDPTEKLPDHQSALTQTTLYVRPEQKIALTIMARTNFNDKITRMADSHCDALRDTLAEQGWL